jgi:hypothetical protein
MFGRFVCVCVCVCVCVYVCVRLPRGVGVNSNFRDRYSLLHLFVSLVCVMVSLDQIQRTPSAADVQSLVAVEPSLGDRDRDRDAGISLIFSETLRRTVYGCSHRWLWLYRVDGVYAIQRWRQCLWLARCFVWRVSIFIL